MRQRSTAPTPPARMEPGMHFMVDGGKVYRFEGGSDLRWMIREVQGATLGRLQNVPADFACTLVSEGRVHERVLEHLSAHVHGVERGSENSRIWDSEISGSWGKEPGYVTRKRRFALKLLITAKHVAAWLGTWGPVFLTKFFVQLDTLGGSFAAKWDDYDDPRNGGEHHSGGWARGFNSGDDDDIDERPSQPRRKDRFVRGTSPDPERYRDESKLAKAVALLRPLKDHAALAHIAEKAVNTQIRRAAKQLLPQRSKTRRKPRG